MIAFARNLSGTFIDYSMFWNCKYKKLDILKEALTFRFARKNIRSLLQWKTIHEQKPLVNHLILRHRQKPKLYVNICFTLVKLCRVQKRRRKRQCH